MKSEKTRLYQSSTNTELIKPLSVSFWERAFVCFIIFKLRRVYCTFYPSHISFFVQVNFCFCMFSSFFVLQYSKMLKLRICFLFYLNFILIANANFLLHDEYTRHKHRKETLRKNTSSGKCSSTKLFKTVHMLYLSPFKYFRFVWLYRDLY